MIEQSRIVLLLAATLILAACEALVTGLESVDESLLKGSAQPLLDAGATRLDAAATESHVSGNTEFWEQGAVYYNADGRLDLLWHKVSSVGRWEIFAKGDLCFIVPTWKRTCHHYLDHDGVITAVTEGNRIIGVLRVKPGKQLRR